jgi:2-polyprenyl-3-methyl-5-hydroxy-6-metoxy-1,4-benzoquinol methylase
MASAWPDLKASHDMSTPTARNFNEELKDTAERTYSYNFDFDVMHPYMLESFKPFFRPGNMLELGCFRGAFTRRLHAHYPDLTCVEASDEAIAEARQALGPGVQFHNALFEQVVLPRRYDHIVMTHVLEHLDDPVAVLQRVNREWLAPQGRFFLVCPNANAPSRQIAVKMGLISHNAAVTKAEALRLEPDLESHLKYAPQAHAAAIADAGPEYDASIAVAFVVRRAEAADGSQPEITISGCFYFFTFFSIKIKINFYLFSCYLRKIF